MKPPIFTLLAAALIWPVITHAAQANDSAYTDLDLDKCRTVAEDEMGASLLCRGYAGYDVHFAESDLRQSILYGAVDKILENEVFESFEVFNHVGSKIEWRRDTTGTPFATILRWFTENVDDQAGMPTKESTGQVLVISRVAQPGDGLGCVVGYVDALSNPDANELARKVADEQAQDFACGRDKSTWFGKRGDKSGEPTYVWPETSP
ncbi:hypothetical protein [Ciceribacter azotifigens]|uniref:hypothetical protein n=1 Tax=Ciceribacter azotifigens TaxID=2069303 RepID=UPI003A8B1F48